MRQFIIVLLCFIMIKGESQNRFSNDLEQYRTLTKDTLSKYLVKSSFTRDSLTRLEMVITPLCHIHHLTSAAISKNEIVKSLSINRDTLLYTYELSLDKKLYAIPIFRYVGEDFFSVITTDKSSIDSNFQVSMVKLADRLSRDFFFVDALPRYPYGDIPIAFINHGNVSFIDKELNVYPTLEGLVLKYYGSLTKYLEVIAEDSIRSKLRTKLRTLEGCKFLLQSSYNYYQKHRPKDTSAILNLFINEVDSLTSLTIEQKTFLLNKLHELIFTSSPGSCKFNQCLVGNDPLYDLEQVLTDQQYFDYLKEKKRLSWLQSRARDAILIDLQFNKKIPVDKVDQAYDAFIFGE